MNSELLERLMNISTQDLELETIDYPNIIDNELEIFKSGGKIHIKKKNRGSFTRWCGGNVTEECIARGKRSKNPAIRKKAVFAANSRRWHH